MSCLLGLARASSAQVASPVSCMQHIPQRSISSTPSLLGKRNVRKFFLGNKRGTRLWRRDQAQGKFDHIAPVYTEVKDTGFKYDGVFHKVPEMIPEIIVPDLTDCQLKPYVSYRTADIYQTEFSAQDLFDVVYRPKIAKDFKENKLDESGAPLEPSPEEAHTPEEAWIKARQCGNDIFSERTPKLWECLEKSLIDEPLPTIQISSDDLTHPAEEKKKLEAEQKQLNRIAAMSTPKISAIN